MRRRRGLNTPVVACVLGIGSAVFLAGCAATPKTQPYRTFFIPPPAAPPAPEPLPEPPGFGLYISEVPTLPVALPRLTRPTETDFLLRQADAYFANGKRAFQESRIEDARREFNRAIEVLFEAPTGTDRLRIEAKLETLTEAIYKYDLDRLAAHEDEETASFEKRPLDEILHLTFPVEPSLRSKVQKEVQGTGSELPLDENDAVLSYINFFTSTRGKRILEGGIKRSGRYRAMIERILAEERVPKEMIFLAQAESGFAPRAVSYMSCVGMWQFAQFRGKEYGLFQTPATDDRMDPEMATRAAARHLRDLYNHFGDWYLAMAAYNCGPGCVDSAVARTGYADFWMLRRLGALPSDTANYVPAILAMTIIAKNASDYGVTIEYDPELEYDTIQIASPTHLALAATALDRPISDLKELNPALMRSVAPAGYSLHIPKGTLPLVEAAFRAVPAEQRDSWRIHRVEYGDTLASLSKRYGAGVTLIASANGGDLPSEGSWAAVPVAYPGERIPVKVTPKASAKKPAAKPTVRPTPGKASAKAGTKSPTTKPAVKKPALKPGSSVAGRSNTKSPSRRASGA